MDITGMGIEAHWPKGEWKETRMDTEPNGHKGVKTCASLVC